MPSQTDDGSSPEAIENEIRELEEKLAQAKLRSRARSSSSSNNNGSLAVAANAEWHHTAQPHSSPTMHFLLLLADSALPLGSFAFSSGLESYLAHAKFPASASSRRPPSFDVFLPLSISSYASTTLPFLLAAYRDPSLLAELDDALDAAVICTVGKRASVAQGRALLGIWERSFSASSSSTNNSIDNNNNNNDTVVLQALADYTRLLRTPTQADNLPPVAAHLAPLFGVISSLLGLSLDQTAYVFMLGHVKALVSAAVRANLMGPYAAQKVLASATTQDMIATAIKREWATPYEEAGQSVPVMDLWIGRHEMLYSRIFNS